MGCCQSRQDAVWVHDHVRIRWPKLETPADLVRAVHYAVAKQEQARGGLPGVMKASEVASIIDILVTEVGSEELRVTYEALGGKTFVLTLIATICAASKGKKRSKGV